MNWPLLTQIRMRDLHALGETSRSSRSVDLRARTASADRVVDSVCPYCAVGCGQKVYVRDEKILDIEGDPKSPISRGCLCPKGSATFQLVTGSHREQKVLYRRPHGKQWEALPLDRAMEMIADRVQRVREDTWEDKNDEGKPLHRTLGMAHLGGATLDNEENYLIKKLFTALGVVQVENQARV
jgi:formate dehydrogenase major subunit